MKNLDSVRPPNPIKTANATDLAAPQESKTSAATISLLRPSQPKSFKWLLKLILGLIGLAVIILTTAVAWRAANLSDKIFVGTKTSFFQKIKEIIRGSSGDRMLIGESLGQINILLLGIGGAGHEGPYLSDTMIIAQIRPDIGQVSLTSIPRDYLIELPQNLGLRKINSAFAEGFAKNQSYKEAGTWALDAAQKISGLAIPYFAVVDFVGFEKAIDQVGGIDINVEKSFTDSQFPDDKLGYLPPITFETGFEHMDGKRALQFARSRHGTNGEGSDFARSQRQQKVISSLKNKVLSLNIISDAATINRLLGTFADHFHTNIGPGELFRLYKIAKDKNIHQFLSLSLDQETGLICSKILEENGAFVLVPCPDKNEKDIQNFFKNSFAIGRMKAEKSVIWLGTSTEDKLTYQQADKKLKEAGLIVWEVGFKGSPLSENIIYQVNPKPATVEFVKNSLNATEVTLPPPGIKVDADKVDIIVILGKQ